MAAALEAVAGVRPSSTVFEAQTRFQAEFDAIDVADLSSVARRARAAAMHAATQAIGDEIRGDASTFAFCDAVTLITEAGDPATATSSGD